MRKVVSQVEYLLPEIKIIKLGIPLRICSVCDKALCAFSKFKQSSAESSRRLEASRGPRALRYTQAALLLWTTMKHQMPNLKRWKKFLFKKNTWRKHCWTQTGLF